LIKIWTNWFRSFKIFHLRNFSQ